MGHGRVSVVDGGANDANQRLLEIFGVFMMDTCFFGPLVVGFISLIRSAKSIFLS